MLIRCLPDRFRMLKTTSLSPRVTAWLMAAMLLLSGLPTGGGGLPVPSSGSSASEVTAETPAIRDKAAMAGMAANCHDTASSPEAFSGADSGCLQCCLSSCLSPPEVCKSGLNQRLRLSALADRSLQLPAPLPDNIFRPPLSLV